MTPIYIHAENPHHFEFRGEPIQGTLITDLPTGECTVSVYSPVTGLSSPGVLRAEGQTSIPRSQFIHDLPHHQGIT
jgi:hypothetical protein